ncbi:hypothetical protein [Arthrobacter sp. NIO-1057]|uniref:hypothetical protein n=1 Tax=Arthrobacter sp. NIO-1057 TaxID=993071 RepID=UPI00071DDCBE|nr:hypothetical protein [Arthrobacter sp. NIO-1057]KSU67850.1 hypothetical protein AS038_01780 [Arthrobacter sp. NIO-1057]SCB81053.1 hypothetical protein GA0061084_0363 [Arthrobacter sp. NIO-1057]
MISRYHLVCPGCEEKIIARVGAEPTKSTRFYFPCPHCRLPITGSMSGIELHEHRVDFDADVLPFNEVESSGAKVVTVNPFVPSAYDADSFNPFGSMPTLTLVGLLKDDGFMSFKWERDHAQQVVEEKWPKVRRLFQYYLQDNRPMFTKFAGDLFDLDRKPATAHERTTIAYQALAYVSHGMIGDTGSRSEQIFGRFARKHTASMRRGDHMRVFRARGSLSATLERDVFTELGRFIDRFESWEMGRLTRFVESSAKAELDSLVLFRDEFSIVRDLFQQGFELACKCLWPLVAAQNTVKRRDPHDFGDVHPSVRVVPVKLRPKNLSDFDKLSNARKIAYVELVPGWEALVVMLDSKHRNTIGHATAHHDHQTGRIVSDKDPDGVSYIDFLGMTFDVFEALAILTQILRAARVASSPDFIGEWTKEDLPGA